MVTRQTANKNILPNATVVTLKTSKYNSYDLEYKIKRQFHNHIILVWDSEHLLTGVSSGVNDVRFLNGF